MQSNSRSKRDLREIDYEVERLIFGTEVGTDSNSLHPLHVPDYTENMSEAWKVLKQMEKGKTLTRQHFAFALQEMARIESGITIAWPDVLWFLTPERICEAALLAKKTEMRLFTIPVLIDPASHNAIVVKDSVTGNIIATLTNIGTGSDSHHER